jgi:disintegrin and metalloproteinase domain-containing protein 17
LQDGVITANIETKEDIYHIEPSWRHLPDTDDQTMIAYRESDIKFSWTEPDENDVIPPKVCDFVRENGTASDVEGEEEDEAEAAVSEGRTKRSSEPFYTSAGEGSLRQTRCPLLLVADYRLAGLIHSSSRIWVLEINTNLSHWQRLSNHYGGF